MGNCTKIKFVKIKGSAFHEDNQLIVVLWQWILPTCFNNYFPLARSIHHYETRFSTSNKISKTSNYTSSRYELNSFSNVAIDVSNKIKDFSWYTQVNQKGYDFEVESHFAWILLKILWLQNSEAAKPTFIFFVKTYFWTNYNSSTAIRSNKDTMFQLFFLIGCTFPMIYIYCFADVNVYDFLGINSFLYQGLFWPFC